MFNWLFEGRLSVILVLTAVAFVLLAIWEKRRHRRVLIAMGVVVALIGIYWLLGLVQTEVKVDRAQIQQRVEELANSVARHDLDAIERNLSDQFRSPMGRDKKAVVQFVPPGIRLKVSDIEIPEPPLRSAGTTKVNFTVELLEPNYGPFHVESIFDWDADQGWRLRDVHVFWPVGDEIKRF